MVKTASVQTYCIKFWKSQFKDSEALRVNAEEYFFPKDLSNVQAISHGKGKDEKMIPL